MKAKIKVIAMSFMAALTVFALSVPTFAAEDDTVNVMATAFEGMSANILSTIGVILPIALGIMSAVIAIKFGVSFFKRLTGKAS